MYRVSEELLAQLARRQQPKPSAEAASDQRLEAAWLAACMAFGG